VGFGAAAVTLLSNGFGRLACKGPELPVLDSGTSVDMLPVGSDIWRASFGRRGTVWNSE
jgi:hypothetical protein